MRPEVECIGKGKARRAAVEPVIGHLKAEHRMGRNYLGHSAGDAINAVLAAVGYNFRLLLKWLALLCTVIRGLFVAGNPSSMPPALDPMPEGHNSHAMPSLSASRCEGRRPRQSIFRSLAHRRDGWSGTMTSSISCRV